MTLREGLAEVQAGRAKFITRASRRPHPSGRMDASLLLTVADDDEIKDVILDGFLDHAWITLEELDATDWQPYTGEVAT